MPIYVDKNEMFLGSFRMFATLDFSHESGDKQHLAYLCQILLHHEYQTF